MTDQELQKRYGVSEHGNFAVKRTIGVPHPYCVTPQHIAYAADHYCGRLGKEAIEAAERNGIYCGLCRGRLKFCGHEIALLVECGSDANVDGKIAPELHDYLNKCKSLCEEDKYAGFAFVRKETVLVRTGGNDVPTDQW